MIVNINKVPKDKLRDILIWGGGLIAIGGAFLSVYSLFWTIGCSILGITMMFFASKVKV